MPRGVHGMLVILALGLAGAWVLLSLLALGGPACSGLLCPLPR